MKVYVYSVYDRKVEAYGQPFFSQTNGAAIRAFIDHVNENGSPANKHPEDFDLVLIGEFNDADGTVTGTPHQKLAHAKDHKREDNQLDITEAIARKRAQQKGA